MCSYPKKSTKIYSYCFYVYTQKSPLKSTPSVCLYWKKSVKIYSYCFSAPICPYPKKSARIYTYCFCMSIPKKVRQNLSISDFLVTFLSNSERRNSRFLLTYSSLFVSNLESSWNRWDFSISFRTSFKKPTS